MRDFVSALADFLLLVRRSALPYQDGAVDDATNHKDGFKRFPRVVLINKYVPHAKAACVGAVALIESWRLVIYV